MTKGEVWMGDVLMIRDGKKGEHISHTIRDVIARNLDGFYFNDCLVRRSDGDTAETLYDKYVSQLEAHRREREVG